MPSSRLTIKIKAKIYRWARWTAEHSFLVCLLLILIALILGGLVFYQYDFVAREAVPEISQAPIQFKENVYHHIVAEWQSRQKRLESAGAKKYPSPFAP